MKTKQSVSLALSVLIIGFMLLSALPQNIVRALVGVHTYTNATTGDVFLGGDYIELGISKYGSFGTTDDEAVPAGFYATEDDDRIGMSTNPTGFGVEPDIRMDFFMPGTEEERWVVGYKSGELTFIGNSSLLMDETEDVSDNTVTDNSSGSTLRATSVGTFNDVLEITQLISFNVGDKFFRNEVTLSNISESTLESVRYMRNFDPDNTVYQEGEYETRNTILFTHEAGDGKAVVVADTSWNDEDPVYLVNGSRSPIFFYSNDERARVSTFGFSNDDPYAPEAYDSAYAKDYTEDDDIAITITFDIGALAPDEQRSFIYYTSLDNRDFSEVIEDIENDDGDGIGVDIEQGAPNEGDANDDGTQDSEQSNVTSLVNPVTGEYSTLETDCSASNEVSVSPESDNSVLDEAFDYPLGLMHFTLDCGELGATATITQYHFGDYDPTQVTVRKYDETAKVYNTMPGAVVEETTIDGLPALVVTYEITDGSSFDQDGVVDGVIVDPAGPAINDVGVPNTGFGGLADFGYWYF